MLSPVHLQFLVDVDDTLLDNDHFGADLSARLESDFGSAGKERYWQLFEGLRVQSGFADYLGTVQLFRNGLEDRPELLTLPQFMLDYPFKERLYPQALEALAHLRTLGRVAILSDGDAVFQARKIERSGLFAAVQGAVMIYIHKEQVLQSVAQRYPARHYVIIDDKIKLLAAMKPVLGERLTTLFVRQGHYALAPDAPLIKPAPDLTVERIGDLITQDFSTLKERP